MSQPAEPGISFDLRSIPTDHPGVTVVTDKAKPYVNELDAKSRIGYHLARLVLAIISVFLIFLILYILLGKSTGSAKIDIPNQLNLADSAFNKQLNLIKNIQEENKASRDFVLQITQMVLLNLLLPILTAILGYIFGSHSEGKD